MLIRHRNCSQGLGVAILRTGFRGSSNRIRNNPRHGVVATISRQSYEETRHMNCSGLYFLAAGFASYPSSSTASWIEGLGRQSCNQLSSCRLRPTWCDSKLHGGGLDLFHWESCFIVVILDHTCLSRLPLQWGRRRSLWRRPGSVVLAWQSRRLVKQRQSGVSVLGFTVQLQSGGCGLIGVLGQLQWHATCNCNYSNDQLQ